ncbi:MAG: phosphoglucosamine mutase [Flavobacteriales bacterium]|mgnify:CR=1 FL=1|nr:phosphoglucosamine mutase [Flavobacteriales bacterium]MBO72017.1 phosphoglucosamine mutase [Flavobacteriales bacterium]|tara:strand:+ start:901 stop:2304 length:1404 start_codon:yes stop_codon:yes gene_type:complete
MTKIKFGTDGWRAIIAKEYTVENVARVTLATAQWLKDKYDNPSVMIGYDCRFGGKMFAETSAKVLASEGIKVYLSSEFASTPMVSLGVVKKETSVGVVITASHNPPEYNGFKLKGSYGGPMLTSDVDDIEKIIPEVSNFDVNMSIEPFVEKGSIEYIDLEDMYIKHAESVFDLDAIRNSEMNFAYDAMYGAGKDVVRKLLPDLTFMHTDDNPGFEGVAPEPILRNLGEMSEVIKLSENIDCAVATDGDADRIGLFDSSGNFVDAHHIILLLIKYLKEEKNFDGEVITAFSCSEKVSKLCKHYGLEQTTTKIGFKYVCELMLKGGFLLGGEESGGMAIQGHIPERDGVWIGLTIWEYMAKSGKTLEELIDEVYEIVGPFAFERIDLHLSEVQKQSVMEDCASGAIKELVGRPIQRVDDTDGYKFFFNDDEWIMIRPSGTEPVLRTYCESTSSESAINLLKETHKQLLN